MHLINKLLTLGMVLAISATVAHAESLEDYAAKCDQAIGVSVPDFVCDTGTLVPTTHFANGSCDRPNQLNRECDPGSRFQVLTNNATAYVVAHCRKRGHPIDNGLYRDIAVIQHNRLNGATCFYQGLEDNLSGDVKAPSKGTSAWTWLTPPRTAAIGCAGCHDNGPIIRSPYLSQITGPNKLPGAGDFSFNRDQPYSFVGEDFASWKTYKVEVEVDGQKNVCNSCHRMGVNNVRAGQGTARDLGLRATAASPSFLLPNKNPLSSDSPMWMLPGQVIYSPENAESSQAIKNCADQFNVNVTLPDTPGCRITQFSGVNFPSNQIPCASNSPGCAVTESSSHLLLLK